MHPPHPPARAPLGPFAASRRPSERSAAAPRLLTLTALTTLFACQRHDGAPTPQAALRPASSAASAAQSGPEGYVLIPAGRFVMGSPASEEDRWEDEGPQRSVTLTRAFWVKATPVTTGEWATVVGNRPSAFADLCGDQCPVERVSWYEALAYANRLSAREGLGACYTLSGCVGALGGEAQYRCEAAQLDPECAGYRLLTEAEWEYTYRAGSAQAHYARPLDDIAWHAGNAGGRTQPVGRKRPNAWGVHDMAGNVWEWVWDTYGADSYSVDAATDPRGRSEGPLRVLRGGGWESSAQRMRAAGRNSDQPAGRNDDCGLRLARTHR